MNLLAKAGWMGAAVLALMAAASVARAQNAADAPSFPKGGETVTIPYSNAPDFHRLQSLNVRMSINGGEAQGFQVDTGSVGIVVGAVSIPNFDGKGAPGELTYSSSGVREKGVWTTVEITFPDAKTADGKPVVAHVPVLAVTSMECTGRGVNADRCKPSAGPPNPHMLGIGFGRSAASAFDSQLKNAFVQLDEMAAGRMRRGYAITPAGIQLGLSADTVGGGWVWQKLEARSAQAPEGYRGPKDYETAPGTFGIAGKAGPMGTVLMDTGLTNMILELSGAPEDGDLKAGTPVTVYLLNGRLSYSFNVGDAGNPLTPRKVSWRRAAHGAYVNTGLRAFTQYDYCYDAEDGFLGLRVRK